MGRIVGEYVKAVRKETGLSQRDLAYRLGFRTPQAVSNIERGVSPFPRSLISKFAELFTLNTDGLLDAILTEVKEKLFAEVPKREEEEGQ